MYIPSLFILLTNTIIIYSKISYTPAVVPKMAKKKKKALNDSLIIIPHIHAYGRKTKITHPKVHKYLDF